MKKISIIDSHTGGEPTRLIVEGGPELGVGPLSERLTIFSREYDHIRSATVGEPRGSDIMVGALYCTPYDKSCDAGVIFFNNVGYLGMCGHGMMGLIVSLAYSGKISVGIHRIETPVGVVTAELHADGSVSVHNVPAYRTQAGVKVQVEGYGVVTGDIAWGGNWFFLVNEITGRGVELTIANIAALTDFAWRIRQALEREGMTGDNGALIDHIELFSASPNSNVDSRNFVLCPGKAYDRSPCGTGTSAKIACLAADKKLAEGEIWRQESIIGSMFEASYRFHTGQQILPTIRGRAYVNTQAILLVDDNDPFAFGIWTS